MGVVHRYTLLISVLVFVGAAGLLAGKALPSSRAAAANADLAAEWHLDELDGNETVTTPDSSGNGLTGTVNGVEIATGRWAKALAFSTESEVRVPAPGSALEPPAVTLLAWVKASQSPGQYRYVAAEGAHGCAASSYALYTGASGGLVFYVDSGNAFFLSPDAGGGIWDGNWHAVAGTFDGQTVRLFVDGSEVGNGTPAAAAIDYAGADQSRDFLLGDYPAHATCNTVGFSGDIDEARVYSRALTPTEINYLQTFAGDSPPEIPTFALTVTHAGSGVGSVTSQPGGISCGPTCSASYSLGTTVTLTATAAVGSTFAGWSGDCTGTAVCTMTMNRARNVTATFASGGSGGPFALTVIKAGTGDGTVTSTPAGILCGAVCSQKFASGTSVTLHATAGSDASFSGFSGDCSGTTCTVQMNGARNVTATFASGPPRNIVLPAIRQDNICTAPGKCRLQPHQYSCAPGQWVATDSAAPYKFEWQQLYRPGNLKLVWKHEAYGQGYYAKARQFPIDNPSGIYRCLVTATGPGGSTVAVSPTRRLDVAPFPRKPVQFPTVDIRVTGIEVTQGTQEAPCSGCRFSDPSHKICATCAFGTLPSRDQANGDAAGVANYSGVTMAAGKFTVVRVYARLAVEKTTTTLAGPTAKLDVFDSDGKLIATATPDTVPTAPLTKVAGCLCVNLAERANPGSSFNFLIPWEETYHRNLSFRATVMPPVGPGQGRQCGGCRGNIFLLKNVPFKQAATVTIWPIPLTITGGPAPSQTLQQVFGDAQTVMPNPIRILPWDGTLAVDNLAKSDALEEVEDRAEDNDLPSSVMAIGVYVGGAYPGLSINTSLESGTLFDDDNPPMALVPYCCRPLTAVAHEITHALAIGHADDNTPHPDGSTDCGGDSGGNSSGDVHFGEGWPPDYEGRIQGVGFDRRNGISKADTFVEGYDSQGKPKPTPPGGQYFDYMSYCGVVVNAGASPPEPNDWISPHNWQRLVDFHAPPQNLPAEEGRVSTAEGTRLRVIAGVDGNGKASIFDVTPGRRSSGSPIPGGRYGIELEDAAGHVVAKVPASTTAIHIDRQRPALLLRATLPLLPSAAAVVLTRDGREVARRVRSAHAPTAKFLGPQTGSRVGRTPTTLVRFSDRDADGNQLTAKVYYSADRGQSWRVVASGVKGGVARVPSRLLAASNNGRLQVRISDGFNLTTVTSGKLQVAGSPPSVLIIGIPRHSRVHSGEMLLLQGSAFDDRDRALTGQSLTWYLGKRAIAHGEQAAIVVPAARNIPLRLVATDSHRRSAQAVVPLRIAPVRARYLLFTTPPIVSTRARNLQIRVAASAPATFTIAGRRYAVSPKPRTITLHFKPGRSVLRFACSLRSPGGVIRGTYVARRGTA